MCMLMTPKNTCLVSNSSWNSKHTYANIFIFSIFYNIIEGKITHNKLYILKVQSDKYSCNKNSTKTNKHMHLSYSHPKKTTVHLLSLLIIFAFLDFYKSEITGYSFCLTSFTHHNYYEIYLSCGTRQSFSFLLLNGHTKSVYSFIC